VRQVAAQFALERRIVLGLRIGSIQLEHERHQGLGHIEAAVVAEAALGVRIGGPVVGLVWDVHVLIQP
jgi:hypothetical protein